MYSGSVQDYDAFRNNHTLYCFRVNPDEKIFSSQRNFEVTVNYELSANAPEYYKCHMIAFKEIDVELKPSESGVMVSVK